MRGRFDTLRPCDLVDELGEPISRRTSRRLLDFESREGDHTLNRIVDMGPLL